jgi:hypothetical protein
MPSTKDKKIHVEVIQGYRIACHPFDWAIANVPVVQEWSKDLFASMYNSPSTRSRILCTTRHRRKDRPGSLGNLGSISDAGWEYLDTVCVWYEKPSSCSNNGLLPVAEAAHIFFKGAPPDAKKTSWFSEEYANATTLWNLSAQKEEGAHTNFQKFSWEMNLLMMSLSAPLEHGKFSYFAPITEQEIISAHKFCKLYGLEARVYVSTEEQAINLITACEG